MDIRDIKLKVCGMRDEENMQQLVALKPDYMGFIFYPKSKRYAESLSINFLTSLPQSIRKTGVFVDASIEEVKEKITTFQLDAVQLHGNESPEYCAKLKQYSPEVIKAFGIDNYFDFNILNSYDAVCDYFLFDTKTEQHGGSGQLFNWDLLKQYTLPKPYFLSGGLNLESAKGILSIEDARLYALDLNSRFETAPGMKDIQKLQSFFNAIKIPA
jgi:phosphoribosylanthranilate isomerase